MASDCVWTWRQSACGRGHEGGVTACGAASVHADGPREGSLSRLRVDRGRGHSLACVWTEGGVTLSPACGPREGSLREGVATLTVEGVTLRGIGHTDRGRGQTARARGLLQEREIRLRCGGLLDVGGVGGVTCEGLLGVRGCWAWEVWEG